MSRHKVETFRPKEHECYVGWDRGYESYYFYVMRPLRTDRGRPSGDGHVIKCGGLPPDAPIRTADALKAALSPWAELPAFIFDLLEEDRVKRGRRAEGDAGRGPAVVG